MIIQCLCVAQLTDLTLITEQFPYKHDNFNVGTGYKEEESPAYFKSGCDLFCAKCQHCNQSFSDDSRKNGLLVSVGKPGYFCIGRKRYGCTHGYCYECFWNTVKEKDESEQTNTLSKRRKSSRINC